MKYWSLRSSKLDNIEASNGGFSFLDSIEESNDLTQSILQTILSELPRP